MKHEWWYENILLLIIYDVMEGELWKCGDVLDDFYNLLKIIIFLNQIFLVCSNEFHDLDSIIKDVYKNDIDSFWLFNVDILNSINHGMCLYGLIRWLMWQQMCQVRSDGLCQHHIFDGQWAWCIIFFWIGVMRLISSCWMSHMYVGLKSIIIYVGLWMNMHHEYVELCQSNLKWFCWWIDGKCVIIKCYNINGIIKYFVGIKNGLTWREMNLLIWMLNWCVDYIVMINSTCYHTLIYDKMNELDSSE